MATRSGLSTRQGTSYEQKVIVDGEDVLSEVDNSLPVLFNPVLHPTLRMDGASAMPYSGTKPSGEPGMSKGNQTNFTGDADTNKFPAAEDGNFARPEGLRLGMISPGDYTINASEGLESTETPTGRSPVRYGFRFLYNPTKIRFATAVNINVPTDAATVNGASMMFMKDGLGVISMELLLNRIPDVTLGNSYTVADKDKLIAEPDDPRRSTWSVKEKGTEFDIEWLYRTINGIFRIRDTGMVMDAPHSSFETGNIGFLMPNPIWLSVGPTMRYYCRVTSLAHEHIMFSRNMIPTLTRVQITFQRVFRGSPSDIEAFRAASDVEFYKGGNVFNSRSGGGSDPANPGDKENLSTTEGVTIIKKPDGASNQDYVWGIMRMNDYSEEQTAGTMGNIHQESTFNERAIQDIALNPGHGLCQWTSTRWDPGLLEFAKQHPAGGKWSVEVQVEYMLKEMYEEITGNGYDDSIYRVLGVAGTDRQNVIECVRYFEDNFENSADEPGTGGMDQREAWGTFYFDEYKGKPAYKIGTGSGATGEFGELTGTPRDIVDKMLPWARSAGWTAFVDSAHLDAKNRRRSSYNEGSDASDHNGKENDRWAIDLGDNSEGQSLPQGGTEMKKRHKKIADEFGLNMSGYDYDTAGVLQKTKDGYRITLIFGAYDGNHWDHIHFGVRRSSGLSSLSLRADMTTEIDTDDYIGDSPSILGPVQNGKYVTPIHKVNDKWWVKAAPTTLRQYPRNPEQAVNHALDHITNNHVPVESWAGRPMAAIARCFGLANADTEKIPHNIPGITNSPARQFRWLSATQPALVRNAPSTRSFGMGVPIGAILYWDEATGGGYGSVGIAAGYRNGLLQQITTTNSGVSLSIEDVQPNRCLGWTVPVFYAGSSRQAFSLMDAEADLPPEYQNPPSYDGTDD